MPLILGLWSPTVIRAEEPDRDLLGLRVLRVGRLLSTGSPWEPYHLVGPDGIVVEAVTAYLNDLQASGRTMATQYSYGNDLLRWFRFLWSIEYPWSEATRTEARDFCRWVQIGGKPAVTHWRRSDGSTAASRAVTEAAGVPDRAPNPITGKTPPGSRYASATRAHNETVLRHFYDFHLEVGTGPIVNPFPMAKDQRRGRAGAHRSPLEPRRNERTGLYRPRPVHRPPRCIPDNLFNELFAQLSSHRDRALVAFWVSTGARASELLGVDGGDVDPGQQLITVIRKGTRAIQRLPASPDAFVWLRLYQSQMDDQVPAGRDDPLWWTLRRPFRQLTYPAARKMFAKASAALGANWTLHELRHTAAYRMARDPEMPLTDVQWILGHAQITTTQLYTSAPVEDVIASILAHHGRSPAPPQPAESPQYRAESLDTLFGKERPQ